jgi:hypothetical protein
MKTQEKLYEMPVQPKKPPILTNDDDDDEDTDQ